jgi:hypothetical protein
MNLDIGIHFLKRRPKPSFIDKANTATTDTSHTITSSIQDKS